MTKKKPSLLTPFVKFLGLGYVSNLIYMFLKVGEVYVILRFSSSVKDQFIVWHPITF